MRPVLALPLLAVAGFAACNALTGVDDLATRAEASVEAGTEAGATTADAAIPDGDAKLDAGVDACGARNVDVDAGVLAAFPSTSTKTMDGKLDDWGCQTPLVLTAKNAASVDIDASAVANVSAEVRLEWDSAGLYVSYDVTGLPSEGTSAEVFRNDCGEIYVGGPGVLVSKYRSIDRHYIVDHKGDALDYSTGPGRATTGLAWAVAPKSNGFVIEARIDAADLSAAPLVAGGRLPFDVQISRANGTAQTGTLTWRLSDPTPCPCSDGNSLCCCGAPNDRPFCNTRRFGAVELR